MLIRAKINVEIDVAKIIDLEFDEEVCFTLTKWIVVMEKHDLEEDDCYVTVHDGGDLWRHGGQNLIGANC